MTHYGGLTFSLGNFNFIVFRSVLLGWSDFSEKILLTSFLEGQVWLPGTWDLRVKGWLVASVFSMLPCDLPLLWWLCPHLGLMLPRQRPSLFLSLKNKYPGFWMGGEGAIFHVLGVRGIWRSTLILILGPFSFPLPGIPGPVNPGPFKVQSWKLVCFSIVPTVALRFSFLYTMSNVTCMPAIQLSKMLLLYFSLSFFFFFCPWRFIPF